MRAVQVNHPGADFCLVEKPIRQPKDNEVLLRVEACGICHGDAVAKEGSFPGLVYPRIPGHEVVGVIADRGSGVRRWQVGERVGVGWHGGHCSECPACHRAEFGACEQALTTGLSTDGGYAEYMVARAEVLTSIPAELRPVEAAPLLCAGSTTLGALKNSPARGGDLVAIHGLGGLGHLALQYAKKLGFLTAVVSRGRDKETLARGLGCHHYIDASAADAAAELRKLGGARVILCTAPSAPAIAGLIGGLARGGQLLVVTFVNGPMQLAPAMLLRGALSIRGWVGGHPADAVRFSVLSGVRPMVEVFPLEQAAVAYDRMLTSKVHFRSVLEISA